MAHKLIASDGGREAAGFAEDNDCSVRALALAADIPYAEAHAALAACGRKHGEGARGHVVLKAYEMFGGSVEYPQRYNPFTGKATQGPTVAQFMRTVKPHERLVVWVNGHVFAVVNGAQHDHPGLYSPRSRVKAIFRF